MFAFPRISRLLYQAVSIALLPFACGFNVRAWPQVTVSYAGALPISPSADEINNEFHLAKPEQREDLLKRLGVDPRIAHESAGLATETGITVNKLESSGAGLLFIPCNGPGTPVGSSLSDAPCIAPSLAGGRRNATRLLVEECYL
jgi:hypothetical protein